MDTSPKYDIPWELIAESLTGTLTVEEELQLQKWLSSDPENEKKFWQIQELWKNGMEDYRFYRMADETKAWEELSTKLAKDHPEQLKTKFTRGQFIHRRKYIRNLLAIAAVLVGFIGLVWFILEVKNPVIHKTAVNEQKSITLTDGSVITMQQQTRIEVPREYNKSGRTIIMVTGEADFKVVHHDDKPFIVELGTTLVKDIGTRFIIRKEDKMIRVAVSEGKVAFVKNATRETRELPAGSAITFDVENERFGVINEIESSAIIEQLLIFENSPLREVIVSIQKVYGKTVIINDSIANKKFTAKLNGMNYDDAIQVICSSLGLDYSVSDSIYTLKAKTNEQP